MFINLALEAMEHTRLKGKKLDATATGARVIFLLDEFFSLGKISQIEVAAAQLAGFGTKLFIVVQDLSQIKSLYDKNYETFISNAGVIQVFGNSDITTTEFLSKRLGKTSLIIRNQSQRNFEQSIKGSTGDSFNIQTKPLLEPEEITRFFDRSDGFRRQLVLFSGKDPMILQRVRYFDKTLPEYKYFKDKFKEVY